MINFKDVETDHGTNFLAPGIHSVTVKEVVYDTTKKEKIAITFVAEDGVTTQDFYTTAKAAPYSYVNLKHIIAKCIDEAAADGVEGEDHKALAAAISKLIVGKKCGIKLSGEWYDGKLRAKFNYRPFCQADGEDLLKFDEASDIKKEESADLTSNLSRPGEDEGEEAEVAVGEEKAEAPSLEKAGEELA